MTLAAVLAIAGCGGGGGGGSTSTPVPQQLVTPISPSSTLVVPQFRIVVPAPSSSSTSRSPQYVSSATKSVVITLTADSAGIDPTTISGNPSTTVVASCSSGCTVNGPPTPPGTDSFRVVTYDNNVPASGHAINAGQLNNATITAGQNNSQSITLGGIPSTLSISGVPSGAGALPAGTATQTATISIVATDAAGVTIPTGKSPAVKFVDASGAALSVTLADPDANAHGSCVVASGNSACTSGAATSVTFTGPDDTRVLAYDGLAENPVTLTASASTVATNATASFQPKLNAPAFNSSQATPTGVALTASAEIDLFSPTASTIGNSGTEYFTESGWTTSPYNHALTLTVTGSCVSGTGLATAMSQIATVSAGTNDTAKGTPVTATAVASPTAGSCPSTISDGLTSNTTDGTPVPLTVTYTATSISGQAKNRRN